MSERDPESTAHAATMKHVDDVKDHKSLLGNFARTIEALQGALDLLWLNKAHFVGCYCAWQYLHRAGEKVLVHECIECATRRQVAPYVTENWSE